MPPRQGNRPVRRFLDAGAVDPAVLEALAERLIYVGSAHHKRRPGDYNFDPPTNPRPSKSLCDGTRPVLRDEAQALLKLGVQKGLISSYEEPGRPKYVWCVDGDGRPYEAKIDNDGYHGYVLEEDDAMRRIILKEWRRRNRDV